MKSIIINTIPEETLDIIRDAREKINIVKSFQYDKKRFLKNYSRNRLLKNNKKQLEARMIFHSHSIEKGLSHKQIRLGFGLRAIEKLARVMQAYSSKGHSPDSIAFINSISVLRAYFDLHSDHNFDTSHVKNTLPVDIVKLIEINTSDIGGSILFDRQNKKDNRSKSFKNLFLGRWSVREYESDPVNINLINEAIDISLKTPSVCNRQSSRVTIIKKPQLIKDTLRIQGGFRGYAPPPLLIMITADSAASIGAHERNQPFIDGGLFSMSILLSLEYVGLAACPLNAMLSPKKDRQLRTLLSIPPSEQIIMFISVGNFSSSNLAPKSFRFKSSDVVRLI